MSYIDRELQKIIYVKQIKSLNYLEVTSDDLKQLSIEHFMAGNTMKSD